MPDIEFKCSCGNPACTQSVHVRKGAVFYQDSSKNHWSQGYISIYGVDPGEIPEIMLDPPLMKELRDWLLEMYPLSEELPKPDDPE